MRKLLLAILLVAGPLAALAAIWVPLIAQYYVAPPDLSADSVRAVRQPISADAVALLDWRDFNVPGRAEPGTAKARAERLLRSGVIQVTTYPAQPVGVQLERSDLTSGSVGWQLQVASLVVPRLLLDAYKESSERRFLVAARDAVLSFAEFERRQWLPVGLLWNDHAVAARIVVLADFWQQYRRVPDLMDGEAARLVLGLVARGIEMAERPGHYNARTNHGVMQDMALWHAHIAFPGLPQAEDSAAVAFQRLAKHLPYYLGPEGLVLEHSAGYHRFGVELLGRAFVYMRLSGQAVPPEWRVRYEKGLQFEARLRRPDGTLPLVGDTQAARLERPLRVARFRDGRAPTVLEPYSPPAPGEGRWLYPVSGYAVSWTGAKDASASQQAVVRWSRFEGHAHKHADEMAVNYWHRGVEWWTSVGYWPYGIEGRRGAESWQSSNAPHAVGEAWDSVRAIRLERVAWEGEQSGALLDLIRDNDDGYTVRRQYVETPHQWRLVLDTARDPGGRGTQSIWRVSAGVMVQRLQEGHYRLADATAARAVEVWFLGYQRVELLRGASAPGVAAFISHPGAIVPTNTFIARRPSDGGVGVVAWRPSTGTVSEAAEIAEWSGPLQWRVSLDDAFGQLVVGRSGDRLVWDGAQFDQARLELSPGPSVTEQRAALVNAFQAMNQHFPDFRNLLRYRERVTWLTGGFFVCNALLVVGLAGWMQRWYLACALTAAGWAAFVAWLRFYYFVY